MILTKINREVSPDIESFNGLPSLILFQYFHEVIQLKVFNSAPFPFHSPVSFHHSTVVILFVFVQPSVENTPSVVKEAAVAANGGPADASPPEKKERTLDLEDRKDEREAASAAATADDVEWKREATEQPTPTLQSPLTASKSNRTQCCVSGM